MALRAFAFFASAVGTAGKDQVALVIANNVAEAKTLLLVNSSWAGNSTQTKPHAALLSGQTGNDASHEAKRHSIKYPNGYIQLADAFGT